jgi:hypothetical protein
MLLLIFARGLFFVHFFSFLLFCFFNFRGHEDKILAQRLDLFGLCVCL